MINEIEMVPKMKEYIQKLYNDMYNCAKIIRQNIRDGNYSTESVIESYQIPEVINYLDFKSKLQYILEKLYWKNYTSGYEYISGFNPCINMLDLNQQEEYQFCPPAEGF